LITTREKLQYTICCLADLLALLLSVLASYLLFHGLLGVIPREYTGDDWTQFLLLLLVSFAVTFVSFGQNQNIAQRSWQRETILATKYSAVLGSVLAVLLLITKAEVADSRYLFVGIILFNFFFLQIVHAAIKRYLRTPKALREFASRVAVMTTSDRAEELVRDLKKDWSKMVRGIAVLDESADIVGTKIQGVAVRADFEGVMDWIRQDAIDEVYISVPYDTGDSLLPYLKELAHMGVSIQFNLPILEKIYAGDEIDAWMPNTACSIEGKGRRSMLSITATPRRMRDMVIKRLMDIVGSLVGLVISVPIIAVVAIPLKLESPGPIFFKQMRVGLNGRYFYIYKLRSMYMDAEARKKELMAKNEMHGLMFKMADDPRITRVGKFIRKTSIDELPQFWNVLRGEMSLVGTRPPTVDEYKQYESHHKRRLSMKPGITGLWQVSGRSDIENFEDVVRLDVEYIDNWSIARDIKLLFKTVWVVLAGRGAK